MLDPAKYPAYILTAYEWWHALPRPERTWATFSAYAEHQAAGMGADAALVGRAWSELPRWLKAQGEAGG